MKKIFMDANGWVALNKKRDQFHKAALKLNRKLLKEKHHYITTNFVLDLIKAFNNDHHFEQIGFSILLK